MSPFSTRTTTVTFLDGKKLDIEYNYDPRRKIEERILINVETLLPVFGEVRPPDMEKFKSVWNLENFVSMHVKLDHCSNLFFSCLCYQKKQKKEPARMFVTPSFDTCSHGHFHHYCSRHVYHWLKYFLNPLLIAQEENTITDEDNIKGYLYFLSNVIHFEGKHESKFAFYTGPEKNISQ